LATGFWQDDKKMARAKIVMFLIVRQIGISRK
jgi:hypothetical protein